MKDRFGSRGIDVELGGENRGSRSSIGRCSWGQALNGRRGSGDAPITGAARLWPAGQRRAATNRSPKRPLPFDPCRDRGLDGLDGVQ